MLFIDRAKRRPQSLGEIATCMLYLSDDNLSSVNLNFMKIGRQVDYSKRIFGFDYKSNRSKVFRDIRVAKF